MPLGKIILVFAFYRYKVGGFILTRVKILRVTQQLLPDAISVLCFDVFTFILLLARQFLQFIHTCSVWVSKPNTSFVKRNLHGIMASVLIE